eukprot:jgi/Ulvmu1/7783/UM004_0012.1
MIVEVILSFIIFYFSNQGYACLLNANVAPVPFWFAVKPPGGYSLELLAWNGSSLLGVQSNLRSRDNPVFHTVYRDDHRVLEYNDEDPATGKEWFKNAHSKGILMFGSEHATWLQHSVPAFPHREQFYPHAQSVYGQHFACIQMSLEEGKRLRQIILSVNPHVVSDNSSWIEPAASITPGTTERVYTSEDHDYGMLSETDPHGTVHRSRIRSEFATNQVAQQNLNLSTSPVKQNYMPQELDLLLKARHHAGHAVTCELLTSAGQADVVAKPPSVHQDMWDSLVGPTIGCNSLMVESWIHGWHKLPSSCQDSSCTVNAAGVRVDIRALETKSLSTRVAIHTNDDIATQPLRSSQLTRQWGIYRDHAKWAACCSTAAICFGDMNRMRTQRKRGGLAICYRPPGGDAEQQNFAQQLYGRLSTWLLPDSQACSSCACGMS